jgi:rod shape-determining protein MreC
LGELLSRFRYPLTYLFMALVCVATMTSQGRPGRLGPGSRIVLELTLPLQQMVTLPVDKVKALWASYVDLVDVAEENTELRSRIARLTEENVQYREAVVSARRFDELDDLRRRLDLRMVPANVAAQDLSAWFRSIVIDQGANAGIRPGMPVMAEGGGVVGVVAGVARNAAKVLLVIDSQSRVDAYVQRSRARGSVAGGGDRACQFNYALRDADVHPGDLLLTSGLGAVYPKGLVVGRIASIERRPFGLFQRAEVEPAVNFRQLEEVFVILDQRELPPDEAFESDDDGLWLESAAPTDEPPEAARSTEDVPASIAADEGGP